MPRFDKLEFDQGKKPTADDGGVAPGQLPRAAETPALRIDTNWLKQAEQARRGGQYENALRFYSRALEADKSLVAGWLGQVQMLVQLEENPEAELWSRKALELFPNHGDLMAGRAQAFCRMGDVQQAYALSDGALKQPGQSAYRWMVRGEIMAAGRDGMSAACFEKAELLESDWLVPLEIGLAYLYYQRPTKALMHAKKAVELALNAYHPWYVLGLCQMELGFGGQAKSSFQRCMELCPGHSDALGKLGELQAFWPSVGRKLRRFFRRA